MFKSLHSRLCLFMAVAMLCALSLINPSPPGVFGVPAAEGTGIIKGIDTMSEGSGISAVASASKAATLASTAETSSSRLWTAPTALDMMTSNQNPAAGYLDTYPVHRLRGSDLSALDTLMTFDQLEHGPVAEPKPGWRLRPSTISISHTSST